ncbi:MAG: endonuclease/exonuclease/phosphatase family protein [Hyphomonas sp.]
MTKPLNVLTWNIQAAIGTTQFSHYLTRAHHQLLDAPAKGARLIELAAVMKPFDIICIQEVDLGGRRAGFACQADRIAALSGHDFVAKQENRTIPGISRHGNAILSRIPFAEIHDVKLPGKVRGRGALFATLDHPSELLLASVHLSLGKADQALQLEEVAKQVRGKSNFAIMGDLNCEGSSSQLQNFAKSADATLPKLSYPPTYPSWRPKRDLDHIITSHRVALNHHTVLPARLSDHLPVSAQLSV